MILPPVPGAIHRPPTPVAALCTRGYTATIRPPETVTQRIKITLLRTEHLPGRTSDYQLDHLVSLELGGSPRSPRNLWMQPDAQAARDDVLENRWHRQVCDGTLTLTEARAAEVAWKRNHG